MIRWIATRRRRLWSSPTPNLVTNHLIDRSLSGWFVVDQLYRKHLVNFVSTRRKDIVRRTIDPFHCDRILLVRVVWWNNVSGNNGDTDDAYESNIENVRRAPFQSDRYRRVLSPDRWKYFVSVLADIGLFKCREIVFQRDTYIRYFCCSKGTFYRYWPATAK